jgi:hypothetical protein
MRPKREIVPRSLPNQYSCHCGWQVDTLEVVTTIGQVIRALEKNARAAQRDAERARREAERAAVAQYKSAAKLHATASVQHYERYVQTLVSYHHGVAEFIDWDAVLKATSPAPPVPQGHMERAASEALQNYKPTFLDRLLKRDRTHRAELEQGISNARLEDQRIFADAQREHEAHLNGWLEQRSLAQRIVARDIGLYPDVLESCSILTSFQPLGARINITAVEPDLVGLMVMAPFSEIVPKEAHKLTSTGKVSTKNMPAGQYWALLQDHICSCALRLACDIFNVLPVNRVIINLGEGKVNTATGHYQATTMVAAHITRSAMMRINLRGIDPSDSMANFNVRMAFHKTKGFSAVEPITPDEQWVTNG